MPKPYAMKRGPKPKVFTPKDYENIKRWARAGLTQARIAEKLGFNKTYFCAKKQQIPELAEAILVGQEDVTDEAAGVICSIMRNNKHPRQERAAEFWLTHRAGWRMSSEISTPPGQPIEVKATGGAALLTEATAVNILKILTAAKTAAKGTA